MDVFGLFSGTVKKVVAAGPKLNADERKGIQEVIGELGDTLNDSLSLTIIYLSHAKHARDHEFAKHLAAGRERLRESFREFKICGGLFNLRDRFRQLFSPTRITIKITRMREVEYLINALAHGERTVIDFLGALTDWMADEATAFAALQPGTKKWDARFKKTILAIDGHIAHLRDKQKTLTRDIRHVVDRM